MTDAKQQLYLIQHRDRESLIESKYTGKHKLGISTNPRKRCNALAGGTPHELHLLTTVDIVGSAEEAEQQLHGYFHSGRYAKEWFRLSDTVIDTLTDVDEMNVETLFELARKVWVVRVETDPLNEPPLHEIRDELFKHEVTR